MTFKGQITAEMPEESGVSKSSGKAWRRKTYVLTYDTYKPEYPKAVVIDVMGDRIEELMMLQGHWYEVEVDFSVREFNQRYYMSATAWKRTEIQMQGVAVAAQAQPQPQGDAPTWAAAYPERNFPAPELPQPQQQDTDLPF